MGSLGPIVLEGKFVRLEPLRLHHVPALVAAGVDPAIWAYMPAQPLTVEGMTVIVEQALAAEAAGTEFAFAVVLQASGRVVGSTRYMDVTPGARGVEIGWTWYAPDVWAGKVNPEAKLLLLQHAFEAWGAIRVCLKTDNLNTRSQAAIRKLGARYEGTLRNHRIRPDGSYRHSVYFSVIADEWPAVKAGLQQRIQG